MFTTVRKLIRERDEMLAIVATPWLASTSLRQSTRDYLTQLDARLADIVASADPSQRTILHALYSV